MQSDCFKNKQSPKVLTLLFLQFEVIIIRNNIFGKI